LVEGPHCWEEGKSQHPQCFEEPQTLTLSLDLSDSVYARSSLPINYQTKVQSCLLGLTHHPDLYAIWYSILPAAMGTLNWTPGQALGSKFTRCKALSSLEPTHSTHPQLLTSLLAIPPTYQLPSPRIFFC
jgi:hypothetical protein